MTGLRVFSFVCLAFVSQTIRGIPTDQEDCGRCVDKFQLLQAYANSQVFKSNKFDLLGFCDNVPRDVQPICQGLIASFGDEIRLELDTEQMKSLCRVIGECKPKVHVQVTDTVDDVTPAGEYPVGEFVLDSELDGSLCGICRMVTSSLQHLLQDKRMQDVILRVLQGVCKFIPFFKGECENLVKRYGPVALNFLADYLSPQLCNTFHLCPNQQFTGTNFESCRMCEFGMGFIHDTLNDPSIDERITLAIEDICASFEVPENTCEDIKTDLLEHIPEIVKVIRDDINLQQICRESDVCKQGEEDDMASEESDDENDDLNTSEDNDTLYFEQDEHNQ